MTITGIRHVALTVTDLERSAAWYSRVLGCQELFRESNPDRSVVIMRIPGSEFMLGLVQHAATARADGFSPLRTGLDHLCFEPSSREELDGWAKRLDAHGVAHSGVVGMATSPILNFKDPDGIALAFALRSGP